MNDLPEEIQSSVDKLVALVRKYPVNIPIPEVIKLLGVDGRLLIGNKAVIFNLPPGIKRHLLWSHPKLSLPCLKEGWYFPP